jgi:N-acetylmuramoyl-L-alanine amidase
MGIHQHPSPNFNDRPGGILPDMVILHYTGMRSALDALERLCDPAAEVSAHYMIDEEGGILELVDPDKRAWHAGVSHWRGRDNLNHYSIGIELVNKGHEFGYQAFPDSQIKALLDLLAYLKARYAIARHQYVGHSDIAPDRKEDPGEKFPWKYLAAEGFGLYSMYDGSAQDILFHEHPQIGENADQLLEGIRALQQKLRAIGYLLDETGLYDAQTKACVTAFQRHWRPQHVTGLYDTGTDIILNDIMYQYATIEK